MKSKIGLFSAGGALLLVRAAYAVSIPVSNYSFETPVTPEGGSTNVSNTTFGGWTANLFCAVDHPVGNGVGNSGETWSTPVPDGQQVLHLLAAGDPYGVQVDQIIPNTYLPGQTYTVSVWVGNSFQTGLPMHYAVRIFGTNSSTNSTKYLELATHLTNPVATGQWVDVVGSYTVQPNDTLLTGGGAGDVEVNLTNGLGYDTNPGQADVFFDDVKINVTTPLTWNNASGSGDGVTWDAVNQNWIDSTTPLTYNDADPVNFTDTNNSHYAVTLNSTVQPGNITVNNSSGNYTISGTGSIAGTGSLSKSGTGILTLSTVNSYSGGTNVAAGTLVVGVAGALPAGAVTITGGTMQLAASTGLATMTSLAISGTGTLDINNNHVIINYGSGTDPVASIASLLSTGYNGGAWNGAGGIVTSAPLVVGGLSYGIGYADSADAGNPAGLSSGTLEIKYTLLGDADLNGIVNGLDFGILAANFNKGVTGWDKGDFDYNNIVNGIDFGYLAANFNKGASGASVGGPAWSDPALVAFAQANGLMADVPEPVSLGLATLGVAGALARGRRYCAR